MIKELLDKIEKRDKETQAKLHSLIEKIDKMSEKELDLLLGLKDSADKKWKHSELSGSELVRMYRQGK